MSKKSETGHAKNVAAFEILINICSSYGTMYNPASATQKLTALDTQLNAIHSIMQTERQAKTEYDNATNAREIAFASLKKLSTRIVNALAASSVAEQTLDDVRSHNIRIQGKRATPVKVSDANNAAEPPPAKHASVSRTRQSYDSQLESFTRLVTTLANEPRYQPNENELKVATLNSLVTELHTRNTAANNAILNWQNARMARDKNLYMENGGLVPTAMAVKKYAKSIFGASSTQFAQLRSLRFKQSKTQYLA